MELRACRGLKLIALLLAPTLALATPPLFAAGVEAGAGGTQAESSGSPQSTLVADCLRLAAQDAATGEAAARCQEAEASLAAVAPVSPARVRVLEQLALVSVYHPSLAGKTQDYYERLLSVTEKVYGPAARETIGPRLNLAALILEEDWQSAREQLVAARSACERYDGPASTTLGNVLTTLARTYREEKVRAPATYRVSDAMEVQQALAVNTEARLGLGRYQTGLEWLDLATLARERGGPGDLDEARRLTRKALNILEAGHGGHWIEVARQQLQDLGEADPPPQPAP